MVVEADEYDKSFLQLQPRFSVVTSMDADHLDIYSDYHNLKNTFRNFISCTQAGGNILIKEGVDLSHRPEGRRMLRYSLNQPSDYYAADIRLESHQYVFDLVTPEKTLKGLSLRMPGLINVENAVAACAVAIQCGVEEAELRAALAGFNGIHRRFDARIWEADCIYIDDYAHHPEEIRAFIQSVRKLFPGKSILGIFQPHLFSRTRDFADGFAESLGLLDEVVLLPIYPARENPIAGVDAQLVLDKIDTARKSVLEKEAVLSYAGLGNHDVVLTIGAGDIDRLVAPLEEVLKTTLKTKR
jgi:UDP-N-acetylmuramate--alanine ligase